MKNFFSAFIFILSVAVGSLTLAQSRSYPTCSGSDNRIDLDNFCPRMEGVHLPNCCPPIMKTAGLTCNYQIVKERGQIVLTNSSYNTCENGKNVTKSCCKLSQRACYTDPVSLKFIPRLINRQATCCFEQCPPASYWRAAPNANPKITSEHELTGGSIAVCTSTTAQECSVGSSEDCPESDYCPVDPGPVGPGPVGPGPGPVGPGPGPDPTPSGPQPDPGPSGPTPTPDPDPIDGGST